MPKAMPSKDLAPTSGADLAARSLGGTGLSDQTVARLHVLMKQFARFAEHGHGLDSMRRITPAVVASFILAPTSDLAVPGPSLQYFRRLAVRQLFRACRASGLDFGDPTVDLVLPSRSRAAFR